MFKNEEWGCGVVEFDLVQRKSTVVFNNNLVSEVSVALEPQSDQLWILAKNGLFSWDGQTKTEWLSSRDLANSDQPELLAINDTGQILLISRKGSIYEFDRRTKKLLLGDQILTPHEHSKQDLALAAIFSVENFLLCQTTNEKFILYDLRTRESFAVKLAEDIVQL